MQQQTAFLSPEVCLWKILWANSSLMSNSRHSQWDVTPQEQGCNGTTFQELPFFLKSLGEPVLILPISQPPMAGKTCTTCPYPVTATLSSCSVSALAAAQCSLLEEQKQPGVRRRSSGGLKMRLQHGSSVSCGTLGTQVTSVSTEAALSGWF